MRNQAIFSWGLFDYESPHKANPNIIERHGIWKHLIDLLILKYLASSSCNDHSTKIFEYPPFQAYGGGQKNSSKRHNHPFMVIAVRLRWETSGPKVLVNMFRNRILSVSKVMILLGCVGMSDSLGNNAFVTVGTFFCGIQSDGITTPGHIEAAYLDISCANTDATIASIGFASYGTLPTGTCMWHCHGHQRQTTMVVDICFIFLSFFFSKKCMKNAILNNFHCEQSYNFACFSFGKGMCI